jgi:hypothetical protein
MFLPMGPLVVLLSFGRVLFSLEWPCIVLLSVHLTSTQSAQSLNLINIYGPCVGEERENFVQWLFDLNIPDDEDWLLLGDFNFIRSPSNRNKPGGDVNDMLLFTHQREGFHMEQYAK